MPFTKESERQFEQMTKSFDDLFSGEFSSEKGGKFLDSNQKVLQSGCEAVGLEYKDLEKAAKEGDIDGLKNFVVEAKDKANNLGLKDKEGDLIDFKNKDENSKEAEGPSNFGEAQEAGHDSIDGQLDQNFGGVSVTSDDPAVRCMQMWLDTLDKLINEMLKNTARAAHNASQDSTENPGEKSEEESEKNSEENQEENLEKTTEEKSQENSEKTTEEKSQEATGEKKTEKTDDKKVAPKKPQPSTQKKSDELEELSKRKIFNEKGDQLTSKVGVSKTDDKKVAPEDPKPNANKKSDELKELSRRQIHVKADSRGQRGKLRDSFSSRAMGARRSITPSPQNKNSIPQNKTSLKNFMKCNGADAAQEKVPKVAMNAKC